MKLLFITRKYPPMVGGMEKLSFALAQEFSRHVDTSVIAWGKSQKYLPLFLPYAFCRAVYLIATKKITHVHLGDALLSPLGFILKRIFHIPVTVTVNGLDITFKFPLYQQIIPFCVNKLDKVICISQATEHECIKRGVQPSKLEVILCGIYPNERKGKASRKDLEKIIGKKINDKKILVTVGRLVKRKGVHWFIKYIFPKLPNNYIYLIVGEGPEKPEIHRLIVTLHFQDRIMLLGKISDYKLKIIYQIADLFIMPNIKVPNDTEGFGIVALEAASFGLPVIGTRVDGLTDSIINKKTGILINPRNPRLFVKTIINVRFVKNQIMKYAASVFNWKDTGRKYMVIFSKLPK